MNIPQFIRDNTDGGRDILAFLIEAMNGDIDGCKLNHRLTAARLLVIYGHADASDFIAENAAPRKVAEDKQWMTIDPALSRLIRIKTDDGRDICLFLIEVMQGQFSGANPGHRVSAARELLSRAFGKSPTFPLPKPQRSTEPPRSTRNVQATPVTTSRTDPALVADAPAAVLDRPVQQVEPEAESHTATDAKTEIAFEVLDSPRFEFMSECEDPDFDPFLATIDVEYFESYTGCRDPECEVHGEPLDIHFDPNNYHY